MDKVWGELQNEIIKALNTKNKTPLTEENLKISQEFHTCGGFVLDLLLV